MADTNFGIYDPNNPLYKKSKGIVDSLNMNNAYDRMVQQEVSALNGTEIDKFNSIISRYPTLSRDVVIGLIRSGADASTPGIGKITTIDGITKVMNESQKLKKLPAALQKEKSPFATVRDTAYGVFKGTTRYGFALLRSPYDYATTIGRDVLATTRGEIGVSDLVSDISKGILGETTNFGALLRDQFDGGGTSAGSGFFISPESRVGKQQAKAMGEYGRVMGQSYTLGRGFTQIGNNPNSEAYKITSGIIDAVLNVALDPSTYLGFGGVTKLTGAAKGGKQLAEAKGIAQQEKIIQMVNDVKEMPSTRSMKAQSRKLKEGVVRNLDNHYMKADEEATLADQSLFHAEAFDAAMSEQKIGQAIKNTSPLLADGAIIKDIADKAITLKSQDTVNLMGRLTADFINTQRAFPGAIVLEELPVAGKFVYGAQKDAEFAVALAGKADLKVVDLAQKVGTLAGKDLERELALRSQLQTRVVELMKDTAVPVRTRSALRSVSDTFFVDDVLFGEGTATLADVISALGKSGNKHAITLFTNAIEDIWKADAFSNIRAIANKNGQSKGLGGFAIVNPSKIAAKGVELTKALENAATGIYNPVISVENASKALENATRAREAAEAAKGSIERQLKEIEALRDYVSKDPSVATKLINNPEFTDIKDIAELEAKIGLKEAYKEGIREEIGLVDSFGGALNLDINKVNKFILGRRFAPIAEILAKQGNTAAVMRLFKNKIDAGIAGQIAEATTADDVLRILRNHIGDPVTDMNLARSLALRGQILTESSPLTKTTLPVYHKAIDVMEKVERNFSRTKVRSVVAPLDDLDRLVKSTREWMESAKVPNDVIDDTIDKLAKAKAGTDRNVLTVRSKILDDAMIVSQEAVIKRIAPNDPELADIVKKTIKLAGKDRDWASAYTNQLLVNNNQPGIVYAAGKVERMDGAVFVSQFLDTVARFPDTEAVIKSISKYQLNQGVLGKAKALKVFADEVNEQWRGLMLVGRISYVLRNIGEMQIRQYLSGHETLLSNPLGYMAIMMGNANGNKMQKMLSNFSKYENDLLGNRFKDADADRAVGGAIDEYYKTLRVGTSAGDIRATDANVRIFGKVYRAVTNEAPEYHDALAVNIARYRVDDIMQLVAKADTPGAQDKLVATLMKNRSMKINGESRTNIIRDIYNASRVTRDDIKVSKFDNVFLKDPDKGFSYDNLNEVGIRNWLFDPKSTASHYSELTGLMGNGDLGIYVRKLIADGEVTVPTANGNVTLKVPSYSASENPAEYGKLEAAFKKQIAQAFPAENMTGGRAIFADAKGYALQTSGQYKRFMDYFFTGSAKIEDIVNYGPEYRMAYWDFVGRYAPALDLKDLYKLQKLAGETLQPITMRGLNGKRVPVGKKHQTLKVINKEIRTREKNGQKFAPSMTIDDINSLAGKEAANYVREIFYDATRQNMTANGLRLIFPFAQAHFNTIKTWGKLIAKNPVQVYKFGKAYDALNKPGSSAIYDITNTQYAENEGFFYKDEFGVTRFRYPLVGNMAGALAGLATNGKVPAEALQMTAPIQSLNLAMGTVNPGVPGIGPVAGILYSASGRSQAFGPTWDVIRNYVFPFGENQNALSVALPSWLNKAFLNVMNDSATVERGVKNWSGYLASTGNYGDNPFSSAESRDKLMVDARHMSQFTGLFEAFFQSIAPATPAQEVLARVPDNKGKYQMMSMTQIFKSWKDISANNPGNYDGAVKDFIDKFGVNNVMNIISGSTRSVTGTEDAWTFLNRNPEAAAKYAAGRTDVVPYFFPGGEAATSYYNWQKSTSVREKLSPQELADAAAELVYNMELSQISDEMSTYGYSQQWYSQKVIALNNRYGGTKPVSIVSSGIQQNRVQLIGKAIESDIFKKSPVFQEAKEFYDAYEAARMHLQNTRLTPEPDLGSSYWLNTKYRNDLVTLGKSLVNKNPQFANMYYLVFANLLKENK